MSIDGALLLVSSAQTGKHAAATGERLATSPHIEGEEFMFDNRWAAWDAYVAGCDKRQKAWDAYEKAHKQTAPSLEKEAVAWKNWEAAQAEVGRLRLQYEETLKAAAEASV